MVKTLGDLLWQRPKCRAQVCSNYSDVSSMESENEVAVGSPLNPEVMDDLHLKSNSHGNDDSPEKRPDEFAPIEDSGHIDLPHVEQEESKLRAAQESIEKLQKELAQAEEAVAVSKKGSSEEISSLRDELQKTKSELEAALVDQGKLKALESEAARLAEELSASTHEATDLKGNLQMTKTHHEEIFSQVDGLKEKVSMLEEQLSAAGTKTREVEGNLLSQVEAHKAELSMREANEENIKKAHGEIHIELEAFRGRVVDLESALSAASKKAEEYQKEVSNHEAIAKESLDESLRFKSAAEEAALKISEAEQTVKFLQGELDEMKDQILQGAQVQKLLEEAKAQMAKVEEDYCQVKDKLVQLEGDYADEKARATELELKLQSTDEELKNQIDCLKAAEDTAVKIKEQVADLEGMLKAAEDKLKEKEETSGILQAEVDDLKLKAAEFLKTAEEDSKQLEREHQEQLKASEERYQALEKSMFQLEEKTAQLQDSLVAAGSDAETARKKVVELELEVENLLHNKGKFEEGAAELLAQLKSTEEMLSNQVDSLKVAEDKADKANEQVLHLESVLKSTEEKLKENEEVAESLQLQVIDLKSREATSTEHLKEAEESLQKLQLELQGKLETSEERYQTLVSQLQESLDAAQSEAESVRRKAGDLELELETLRHDKGELEEKVRVSEEKCVQHENNAHTSTTRSMELEGLITQHKTTADDAISKIAVLEAALVDAQNKDAELEIKLKLAEDNALLLEDTASKLSDRLAELEGLAKESAAKVAELEMACAESKQKEQETAERLQSGEKMLVERQTEVKGATDKIDELESSIAAMEANLKGTIEREMHLTEEKTLLEEEMAKLEAHLAKLEADVAEAESRVAKLEPLVEKTEVELHAAVVSEGKLKEEISSHQASNSKLQDLLSQIENEKQTIVAQLDSTQKSFTEMNEQFVEERQLLQQQIATLMQENGNLAEKFASTQEKLHATLVAAEVSAKKLQESSSKESTLGVEVEDLKVQLKKALDECSQVEKLEQKLKSSITTEEHLAQINQLLATSRLSESRLVEAEEQLSKSKLEINKIQKAYKEQGTQVKEQEEAKIMKSEVIDRQPQESIKTRDVGLDFQYPGKARQRKKKGVSWEVDGDVATKTKANGKPTQPSDHSSNQILAHLFISIVSLTVGFWLARKVYL